MLEPPDPLPELPELIVPRGTRLFRIHNAAADPWKLASHPNGRFNLTEPKGTCHLAEDPLCSFMEAFVRISAAINIDSLDSFRLSRFICQGKWRLADLTKSRARGAGVNAEIHSTMDLSLTQSWAAAISSQGFEGIRYRARSDPSGGLLSIALFSSPNGRRLRLLKTEPIPDGLIVEVMDRFNMRILPPVFKHRE